MLCILNIFILIIYFSVKSAGFSENITSVCSKILSTEDAKRLTVPNPYVPPEIPNTKIFVPTTREKTTTSESLIEPTDENNEADKKSSNNNATNVENKKVRGNASKNFQNLYLFTMVFIFFVGQAFRLP